MSDDACQLRSHTDSTCSCQATGAATQESTEHTNATGLLLTVPPR